MKNPVPDERPAGRSPHPGNRLLWIVAGVFAVLVGAWTVLIVIAHRHPVQDVPVVRGRDR